MNLRRVMRWGLMMLLALGTLSAGAEEWFAPAASVAAYKPKGPSHCYRQFNVDWSWIAHDPKQIPEYLTQADPAAFAAFCERMHYDGTVVMAVPHHGYCTHNTKVGEKFPGMKGDWFGRTIEELHKRKIAAFGYVTLNWNWKFMREHKGAPFIHVDFNPDGSWKKGELCLNAPGYLELVEAYTREVLEGYPVDGMRWDILSTVKGCACEGCKSFYRELYGEELRDWAALPPERQWDFYLATTERAVRRLHAVCKAVKPSVEIWQNSIQSYAPNNLNVGRMMDIAYNEYGDPFRLLLLKGVMNKQAAINGLMNRTTPVAPLEREAFRWCLALGGRCYSYFGHKLTDHRTLMPGPEMIPWHEHELAPFYQMVAEIEPWLEGARPVSHIGVVYSDNTRFRYKDYKREAYVDPMQKLTEGYLKRSIPLEFVNSLDLVEKSDALKSLKVLVVPQSSGLAAPEVAALRQYAERGGTLLVAGDALRHDAKGKALADFALAGAMGVSFKGIEGAEGGGEATGRLPGGGTLSAGAVKGFVGVEAKQGETLASVRRGETAWPLLQVNRVGAGRMAYLATAEATGLMESVIDALAGAPPVRVTPEGSKPVALTRQSSQKRWVLHLIGDGDYEVALNVEDVPATRIVVQYPQAGWEAKMKMAGRGLKISVRGAARDRLLVLE